MRLWSLGAWDHPLTVDSTAAELSGFHRHLAGKHLKVNILRMPTKDPFPLEMVTDLFRLQPPPRTQTMEAPSGWGCHLPLQGLLHSHIPSPGAQQLCRLTRGLGPAGAPGASHIQPQRKKPTLKFTWVHLHSCGEVQARLTRTGGISDQQGVVPQDREDSGGWEACHSVTGDGRRPGRCFTPKDL